VSPATSSGGSSALEHGPKSMDEKSQIQALDRTQPPLPIKPGEPGR